MEMKTVIRADEVPEGELRRVSYTDLLTEFQQGQRSRFVRYTSSGALPPPREKPKDPEISQEELFRRRMEQIERETYQKVFAAAEQAGLDLGMKRYEQELAALLPRVERLMRGVQELPVQVFRASEVFLVEVAILLVRHLLQHELSMQPEGIVARVRSVLAESIQRDNLVLRVSPGDADMLRKLPEFERMQVVADVSVTTGSVFLESDFGGVAYDLQQQLQRVEESIRSYLAERLAEHHAALGVEEGASVLEEVIRQSSAASVAMETRLGVISGDEPGDEAGDETSDEDTALLNSMLIDEDLLLEVESETE